MEMSSIKSTVSISKIVDGWCPEVSQLGIDELAVRATKSLLRSRNYRSFIRSYLRLTSSTGSALSLRAGKYRGFVSDVLSGKRELTPSAFLAFEHAMKLDPTSAKAFKYLAALDVPAVCPSMTPSEIRNALIKIRTLTDEGEPLRNSIEKQSFNSAFEVMAMARVYAAVCMQENRNTLDQISKRSETSEPMVRQLLGKLTEKKLIRQDSRQPVRWILENEHVFFEAGTQLNLLKGAFTQAAKRAEESINATKKDDDDFYFNSHFLISEARMKDLKRELKRTILSFVDRNISDDGGKVAQLVLAFHL